MNSRRIQLKIEWNEKDNGEYARGKQEDIEILKKIKLNFWKWKAQ
jgi:hypothetical protein